MKKRAYQRDRYLFSAFEESLQATLRLFDNPEKMGAESPLAAPYFLSHALDKSASMLSSQALGNLLREQILLAAAELWGEPLPTTTAAMAAALLEVRKEKGSQRYSYLTLDLRHLHQFFRPQSLREIYENPDYLLDSKSGDHRSYRLAIQHLGERLLARLHPALKLEKPLSTKKPIGYDDQISRCLACINETVTITISGASGTGKSTLGAEVASRVPHRALFWYTIRPTLNDRLGMMLFSLGHFLHTVGASNLWRFLIAASGKSTEPEVALAMLRQDLADLGENLPLICIDEIDLLDGSDFDPGAEQHRQLLGFIGALRGEATLLLIGQRAVVESDLHLLLTGLAAPQIRQLFTSVNATLTDEMLAQLYRYTHGNPRLLHLCLSLYYEGDAIDELLATMPLTPGFLPLLKRLWNRLSASEQQILQQLSVFRSPVPDDQWRDAPAELQHLLHSRLLSYASPGAIELVPALRTGIYSFLNQDQREEAHLGAALIRQQRGEYTAAAYHYWQANHHAQAIHVWFPHLNLELQRGQADAAMAIYAQLSQQGLSDTERQALALIRAELHRLFGSVSEGIADLKAAEVEPKSDLSLRLLTLRGEFEEALGYTEESLDTLEEARLATISLLKHLGTMSHRRGALFLRQRRLINGWEEINAIDYALHALRGELYEEEGRYDEAQRAYEQALQLAESMQDLQVAALAYLNLAALFGRHQDYDKAIGYAQQAMTCHEQVGDRWSMERLRTNMAYICIQTGHFAEAIEHGTQAYRFFAATKIPQYVAVAAVNLADAYVELGDLEQAQVYAEKTLDQEDRKTQPYAHFNLGRIAFQRNDFAKANAHFDESIRSAQQNQDPYLEAYAHRELGLLFQATHQASESRHSFQQALDLFEQLGIESEIEATRQLMADAVVDR